MGCKSILSLGFLFFLISFSSCAQPRFIVRNVTAFYKVSIPGNVAVDENGNPKKQNYDTLRFVVLEYKGTAIPDIQQIEWAGRSFSLLTYPVEKKAIVAGSKKNSNDPVILTPHYGYQLLRIDLKALQNITSYKKDNLSIKILTGKSKKILYKVPIENMIELNPDMHQ